MKVGLFILGLALMTFSEGSEAHSRHKHKVRHKFNDHRPKMERKLKGLIRRIQCLSDKGQIIKGPILIKSLDSENPQKLLFSVLPYPKKEVAKVLYAIKPKNTPFSAAFSYKSAPLSQDGRKAIIDVDISALSNGDYRLFLSVVLKDKKSKSTGFAMIQFTKDVQEFIDGDLVPPKPGADADATLLGVDTDQDGVRDDVELWINSQNLMSLQRKALVSVAKKLQEKASVSQNREQSNVITREIINLNYCLQTRMEETVLNDLLGYLKVNQYNTKERLIEWARTEGHFGGSRVVVDLDEANWPSYCEE